MAATQQIVVADAEKAPGHDSPEDVASVVDRLRRRSEEILVRLDRAATKLLALASTVGVMGALTVTSAMPAGAATSSGPRHQAIVALAGPGPVSVPGLRVQSYLGAVHAEIVDGTPAQLAQLAATP